ncbi:MAG: cbb3-type cytochrome c oxidase subunit 3 [Bacteroidales bacterium]|nr:cbb3-type cytochrome c oxidase subunit 3 [Bacteroidales bacterium]
MKIVTKTLEGIADIQIYPIIGLILFFAMFVFLIIHVVRLTRNQVDEYSNLPLDDNSNLLSEKKDLKNNKN